MNVEEIVREYYSAWERKDWETIAGMLADDFTFTSPNDDDHIDIPAYHEKCWGQAESIERFELESVLHGDNEAFVKYVCTTTKATSFRNTEYFQFAGEKISAIEVYFGGKLGYPTASVAGRP